MSNHNFKIGLIPELFHILFIYYEHRKMCHIFMNTCVAPDQFASSDVCFGWLLSGRVRSLPWVFPWLGARACSDMQSGSCSKAVVTSYGHERS